MGDYELSVVAPSIDPYQITCDSGNADALQEAELCVLCGSRGDASQLLMCMDCGDIYHRFCFDRPVDLPEQLLRTWRCVNCKLCNICEESCYDDLLLVCDVCERGFHTFCMTPSLKKVPEGDSWLCLDCRPKCKGCGEPVREGQKEGEYCPVCVIVVGRREFCPICEKTYKSTDWSVPMVCCDGCDMWVHNLCDGIDEALYTTFFAVETNKYFCPSCRPKDSNVLWQPPRSENEVVPRIVEESLPVTALASPQAEHRIGSDAPPSADAPAVASMDVEAAPAHHPAGGDVPAIAPDAPASAEVAQLAMDAAAQAAASDPATDGSIAASVAVAMEEDKASSVAEPSGGEPSREAGESAMVSASSIGAVAETAAVADAAAAVAAPVGPESVGMAPLVTAAMEASAPEPTTPTRHKAAPSGTAYTSSSVPYLPGGTAPQIAELDIKGVRVRYVDNAAPGSPSGVGRVRGRESDGVDDTPPQKKRKPNSRRDEKQAVAAKRALLGDDGANAGAKESAPAAGGEKPSQELALAVGKPAGGASESDEDSSTSEEDKVLFSREGIRDDWRECELCHMRGDQNSALLGRLLHVFGPIWVHAGCAMWSDNVDIGDDGELGHIDAVIKKARGSQCAVCDRPGATLACDIAEELARLAGVGVAAPRKPMVKTAAPPKPKGRPGRPKGSTKDKARGRPSNAGESAQATPAGTPPGDQQEDVKPRKGAAKKLLPKLRAASRSSDGESSGHAEAGPALPIFTTLAPSAPTLATPTATQRPPSTPIAVRPAPSPFPELQLEEGFAEALAEGFAPTPEPGQQESGLRASRRLAVAAPAPAPAAPVVAPAARPAKTKGARPTKQARGRPPRAAPAPTEFPPSSAFVPHDSPMVAASPALRQESEEDAAAGGDDTSDDEKPKRRRARKPARPVVKYEGPEKCKRLYHLTCAVDAKCLLAATAKNGIRCCFCPEHAPLAEQKLVLRTTTTAPPAPPAPATLGEHQLGLLSPTAPRDPATTAATTTTATSTCSTPVAFSKTMASPGAPGSPPDLCSPQAMALCSPAGAPAPLTTTTTTTTTTAAAATTPDAPDVKPFPPLASTSAPALPPVPQDGAAAAATTGTCTRLAGVSEEDFENDVLVRWAPACTSARIFTTERKVYALETSMDRTIAPQPGYFEDITEEEEELLGPEATLPFRVGPVSVLSLGSVVYESNLWHQPGAIFPLGFRSARHFWSHRELNQRAVYICEILGHGPDGNDVEEGPIFRITCPGGPGEEPWVINKSTPTEAWRVVIDRVNKLRRDANRGLKGSTKHCLSLGAHSGHAYFGLDNRTVTRSIESLPYSWRCIRYSFQFFERTEGWLDDVPLAVHASGCARTEPFHRKSKAARHARRTTMPTGVAVKDGGTGPANPTELPATRTTNTQKMELPTAMRYRQLMASAPTISVRRSGIEGLGVYAEGPILPGQMCVEYIGEVIRAPVADRREVWYDKRGIGCYMFRIDEEVIVDATRRGNYARFINHSCDPNCATRIINTDGTKHIIIESKRHIVPGEELSYDYMFPIEEDKIPCLCGAALCRGSMN